MAEKTTAPASKHEVPVKNAATLAAKLKVGDRVLLPVTYVQAMGRTGAKFEAPGGACFCCDPSHAQPVK